ncbi:hypothetical protein CY34DRAFT_805137 [Suillus luteus UH-Slu-Lm8-n1]|uniref:Uncharacterized protein n=1 Tax=Suillus luteus UH-Slu-Lm8-n1 TaxID=930992 RepID=A0A0D0AWK5_9AGAM|nr:hypothetical protein CY34DRAFT_805137 [Suillus luteus UH-Slu-Lm8-n1]
MALNYVINFKFNPPTIKLNSVHQISLLFISQSAAFRASLRANQPDPGLSLLGDAHKPPPLSWAQFLSQQSLLFTQLVFSPPQRGPRLAVTDITDAVNATIKVRKEKRIVCLRLYDLLWCVLSVLRWGECW